MANTDVIYSQFDWKKLSRKEQLVLMDDYYSNNSLYETTRLLKYYLGVWNEDIRPIRTPVHRSVEFYVSKIAIGDPMVSAKSQSVVDAVTSIMDWSNFNSVKPRQVRNLAKYGGTFRKVVSENGKVWHEMIDTRNVTSVVHDIRGFVTEIRIDTPMDADGAQRMRTEYWTVNDSLPYMAVWEHLLDENAELADLGDPIMYSPLRRFGIDFVPFVHDRFADDGEWGANCVEHALLKVDEANRQATRLHQILYRYNKPTWLVSANQTLPDGTPVAPPKLKQGTNPSKTDLEVRDNSILYLPGQATASTLVPQIDYSAALAILQSQEKELEKDLPELLYYSIPERADMSGKALRTLLGAAIDRATQAQASYVEGLVRLNQMAITIGQFQGIFPAGLGNFDAGTTQHSIRFAEQFPLDMSERALTLKTLVEAGVPLQVAASLSGFTEEEVSRLSQI